MEQFLLSLILPFLQAEIAAKVTPPSAVVPTIVANINSSNPGSTVTVAQFDACITGYFNWLESKVVTTL